MNNIKIAVMSDVHAFDSTIEPSTSPVSFLDIKKPESDYTKHPISGLFKLIADQSLQADYLLLPGDLSDKACIAPLKYVWSKIQSIKEALGSTAVLPTAGNHDLDSRYIYNDYDAKGVIQDLNPHFPIEDENSFNKYWAKNYIIIRYDELRFLIINSSAYHGNAQEEINFGRISQATIRSIEKELSEDKGLYSINIMLCHHCVDKYKVTESDNSVMKGGDKIVELLNTGEYGNWLIIHGHKHNPNLYYSAGGGDSSIIFSAGSFSAVLYFDLQTNARNQFYIIDINIDDTKIMDSGIVGTIYSWDWYEGIGWQEASFKSGLPYICNFGNRESPSSIANQINSILSSSTEPYLYWSDLIKNNNKWKYILPSDLQKLTKRFEKMSIKYTWESNSCEIFQIGKTL
jgi:predicted MPP superfamily phosphohydrolase